MLYLNLISFIFIIYASFVQYRARSAAIVFSIFFLCYVVFPLLIPIEIYFVGEDAFASASFITIAFCAGYLISQCVSLGRPVYRLNQINLLISKTRLIYLGAFYLLSFYIIIVVVLSNFSREISSLYFNNRLQIAYVFSLAILMWTAKKPIDRYKVYFLLTLVSFMLFLSGSRIYIVPSILFIFLFKLSFDQNKRNVLLLSLVAFILLLSVSLFRNFDGELFSLRSVVGLFGEFYFTHLSFLLVLDGQISFPHKFYEGVLSFLFPYLLPDIDTNSDRYINQIVAFDFGLASSFFNDIALYQQNFIFPYFFSGLLIGLFYKIISVKSSGIARIFSLIFLSFTPILFRSGIFYTFALIKTLVIYIIIIGITSWIFSLFGRSGRVVPQVEIKCGE